MHIFDQAAAILEVLARQDCSAALAWCAANRARLRKIRSKLEFMLRIQVREGWRDPVCSGLCSRNRAAHVHVKDVLRGVSCLVHAMRRQICCTGVH